MKPPPPPPPKLGDHWESPNGAWIVTWDIDDPKSTVRSGEIIDRDTFDRQRWIYDRSGCRLARPERVPDYVKNVVHYFGTIGLDR